MAAGLASGVVGCEAVGQVGAIVSQAIPKIQQPQYKNFAGQSVAFMCWADRGVRIDNPYLQVDVASAVEDKIAKAKVDSNLDELKGTTFPVSPRTVARYQEDHPELQTMSIADAAGNFAVSRLVYVEVTEFATRSEASLELYRGTMHGNLKVLEIANGKAHIVFEEDDISTAYPKDSPKEGLPVGTDYKIYTGTVDAFTTLIANRLIPHELEP